MSGTGRSADLLMQHRCLACGHLWRKSPAADHDNCPEWKSPNWASVDSLERAQRLDPIEQRERGERERERSKRETERAKARRELSQDVKALLTKHNLTTPEETAEMIVKTIVKCRVPEPRPTKHKGEEPSPRRRLTVARTHAIKLLEDTTTGASHKDSVAKRSERLRKALDDSRAVIWLASATPPVHVPELLDRLKTGGLHKRELAGLVQALDSILSKDGRSTGRPPEETARIVRAGCIAWLRAGQKGCYGWDGFADALVGPLPKFIRDLFSLCAGLQNTIELTDAALHSQLKVALTYCKRALSRRTH
jgi:hypothetical protein